MSVLHPDLLSAGADQALPVHVILKDGVLDPAVAVWARAHDFTGKAGQLLVLPDPKGTLAGALFGAGDSFDPGSARGLAARLPAGVWRLEGLPVAEAGAAALAFALGAYRFDRYRTRSDTARPRLIAPDGMDVAGTLRIVAACELAREMVDTPAADMGPLQIETIAREIASESGASIAVTEGEALLEANYPAIHAVGRAASPARQPRLIEIGWQMDRTELPLVALVGKGVVFDTGGLNIKGGAGGWCWSQPSRTPSRPTLSGPATC